MIARRVQAPQWLSAMWLPDPLPAWRPPGAPLRRLIAGPKHHLADPALAARLLDVGERELLDGLGRTIAGQGPLLGALFESLCALSVRVIAQSLDARVSVQFHRSGPMTPEPAPEVSRRRRGVPCEVLSRPQ